MPYPPGATDVSDNRRWSSSDSVRSDEPVLRSLPHTREKTSDFNARPKFRWLGAGGCRVCCFQWPLHKNVPFWLTVAFLVLCTVFVAVWLSLLVAVTRHLTPDRVRNGVQDIADNWRNQKDNRVYWVEDFTRGVEPVPVHSHNDYKRPVPLYNALAAGCTGVEADLWISNATNNKEILVGHKQTALSHSRTLRSLYLNPLTLILNGQNSEAPTTGSTPPLGVFDSKLDTTLVLLLDFKTGGKALWPLVQDHLKPFRAKDWLSYWDGSKVVTRPITVVASGIARFEDVLALDATHRDIFFDAPLAELDTVDGTGKYNASNSLYASAEISKAIGKMHWPGTFSRQQREVLGRQIGQARRSGLRARYWGTPAWPIAWRDRVWTALLQMDVGMLNVDELVPAARWDWRRCVVMGIALCGWGI